VELDFWTGKLGEDLHKIVGGSSWDSYKIVATKDLETKPAD
jgi:hypothetical protein